MPVYLSEELHLSPFSTDNVQLTADLTSDSMCNLDHALCRKKKEEEGQSDTQVKFRRLILRAEKKKNKVLQRDSQWPSSSSWTNVQFKTRF